MIMIPRKKKIEALFSCHTFYETPFMSHINFQVMTKFRRGPSFRFPYIDLSFSYVHKKRALVMISYVWLK